jgi:hypothetical protein
MAQRYANPPVPPLRTPEVELMQHCIRQSRRGSPKGGTATATKEKERSIDAPTIAVTESEWPQPSEAYSTGNAKAKLTVALTVAEKPKAVGLKPSEEQKRPATASCPPPNAPTAPKALRSTPVTKSASQAMTTSIKSTATTESGSWSQSKRWVSPETKERMAFHKMKLNLHHIQAGDSPFVPQSPKALAELKVVREKRRLARDLQRKQKRDFATKDGHHLKLFWGKKIGDMLSPVLAWNHCFTEG